MKIHKISSDLFLIQLDQELTGFTEFIGSWLYRGDGFNYVVDVGPAATIPVLIRSLEELGVDRVDGVLLTHIHIDHAGGAGGLLERFPDTPIVCHQSGIKHLADPARLWEGSKKTLGDTAIAYGPIGAVPDNLLCDAAEFTEHGIQPVATPGHAVHHVSYVVGPYLFAGEAGGVYTAFDNGDVFLRPATPPRFIYEISVESIDKLLAVPHQVLCYGHFGVSRNTPDLLKAHKGQLALWLDTVSSVVEEGPQSELLDVVFERLLACDPLFKMWGRLSPAEQQREKIFVDNSIRGFIGYLKNKK